MNCPQCEKLILAEHVNLDTLFAKCIRCQHVFRFEALVPVPPKPAEPVIVKPKRFELVENEYEKDIVVKHTNGSVLLTSIVSIGFMIFSIIALGSIQSMQSWHEAVIAALISMLFLLISASLFYFLIFSAVNTMTIGLNDQYLFVAHKPLPWFDLDIVRESITEIDIEPSWTSEGTEQIVTQYYAINVLTRDGVKSKLGLSYEIPEARFIVYWLNRWLNLSPSKMGAPVLEATMESQIQSASSSSKSGK